MGKSRDLKHITIYHPVTWKKSVITPCRIMAIKRRKKRIWPEFQISCWFPYKINKNTLHQTFNHIRRCHCNIEGVINLCSAPKYPHSPWLVYATLKSSLQFNDHKSPVLLLKLQTWWKGVIFFILFDLGTFFVCLGRVHFFLPKTGLSSILLFCNCWSAFSINGKCHIHCNYLDVKL